jgi:hypothetical protein
VTLAGSTNPLFAANCRAIGRPELAADPRFASNGTRVQHSAELNALFGHWIAQRPLAEVLAAFDAAGGTVAPGLRHRPDRRRPADAGAPGPVRRARRRLSAACRWPPWCRASPSTPAPSATAAARWASTTAPSTIDELGLTEAELQALIDAAPSDGPTASLKRHPQGNPMALNDTPTRWCSCPPPKPPSWSACAAGGHAHRPRRAARGASETCSPGTPSACWRARA